MNLPARWLFTLVALAGCGGSAREASSGKPPENTTSATVGSGGAASTSATTAAGGGGGRAGAGGAGGAGGGGTTTTTGGAGHAACSPGRTTTDRPDDAPGYQIHVDYVLPADGVDEHLDTNGRIATSVAAFTGWFKGQTGAAALRFDTCGGALDIRFVRVNYPEAELKSKGFFIRDAIEAALVQDGLINPKKIEAVYYGGDAESVCGGGPWPPALIGHVAALYLKGTFTNPAIPSCGSNPLGANASAPGYLDFAMLHEVMHALGIVPTCAPHETLSGHVSDSPTDLMYAGPLPWMPSVLDFNRDDYYEAGVAGCLDLSTSAFLEPLPAGATSPPGW